ncbi:MAG: accessory Sec system translocase SecA2 [Calditrichaceae bacterium]
MKIFKHVEKIKRIHRQLQGSTIEYNLNQYQLIVNKIITQHKSLRSISDQTIKDSIKTIRKEIRQTSDIDKHLIHAFALIIEVINRTLQLNAFDVQLIGATVITEGKIAQMQTGEGKTLTAVFPALLNALEGNGVHILTFNDYLAKRDAEWMRPVYDFLGLSVGYVQEGMSAEKRRRAYNADVTYLSAKEAGFDFLRDSLCYDKSDIVQRPFNYAIIDEADSILIDEARIPLVIAGTDKDYVKDIRQYARVVNNFKKDIDFEFDEYARNVQLTDSGLEKAERELNCGNLYSKNNIDKLTGINCALHAEFLLHKDIDYIIKNEKIELVDEYTGRVADKRRWPDGLQAALEAKEQLKIQAKGRILNSISLQHFIRFYPKISGMTATAESSDQEFKRFYNLDIVIIPPNKKCIREDHPNRIFKNREVKHAYLLQEIIHVHKTDRPLLVGTSSVGESEIIARRLRKEDIKCSVLNAKDNSREAQIIAEAGVPGAVTISTNMAGRGIDIKLGGSDEEEKASVTAMGGLYIIGTNMHESARIDRQLRGRAGRQGDPGSSRFFISLEDDLFVKYRLHELIPDQILKESDQDEIDNVLVRREAERIQRICDGQNLEIKKTLIKYSDLVEKQRNILFNRRKNALLENTAVDFMKEHCPVKFNGLELKIGLSQLEDICRKVYIFYLDAFWSEYLSDVTDIRESIHLKRIGGQDPYFEFQKIVIDIFDDRLGQLDKTLIKSFKKIKVTGDKINLDALGIKSPAATWTYLVNDNPFENNMGFQLIGNAGMQVTAGVMGPLMALELFFRKKKKES